ncbi:MAG TPA: efflux RND transporter periplasmic adaptor subunit [Burkholderiales bacterium]|nr:efflux RND transporter periplasmic adaptor subunit [Burkholderiales bacterium]
MSLLWRPHAPAILHIVSFIAVVCGCSEKQQAAPEPRLVSAIRVSSGSGTNDVAYSGEIRPRYESNLSFRVPGKIVARNVEVGSIVAKGNPLARLDPEDQNLNTRSAESQQAAARSEYEQSKAELERYTDLYQKQFISKAEFDRHQNAFNVAKARLEQSQAQLAVSKNQTGYTELSADHAGVVTAILVEVGQVVAAGQTVMKIARTDDREVSINVPENRLAELSTARQIDISLWSDPSRIYKGKLREVSPSADPVTRTYAAKISVLNADGAMKLGMTANVYLRGLQRTSSMLLPATALFQENGHAAVWVVDKSGKVSLVRVEISEYVDDRVGVISGLSPGDLIVRAGVHKLYPGEKVRVHEEPVTEAGK